MKRERMLTHEFVEFIPDELKDGTIYASIPYSTVAHKCCCGCGTEVVTPLSPTDWELIFDGESISLDPSIGNWSFDCKSHYWIRRNRVRWARRWSQKEIEAERSHERLVMQEYFENATPPADNPPKEQPGRRRQDKSERRFWPRVGKWKWWS